MKDKKHIDKLFKDRFNDFDVSPSPEVWGSIQTSLEKRKKDRNLIPLWWKLGGVAALLALFFTVGNSVFNSSETDSKIVVSTEETTKSIESDDEKNPSINDEVVREAAIASEEEEEEDETKSILNETQNSSETKSVDNLNSEESIYNKVKSSQEGIAVETKASDTNSKEEKTTIQKKSNLIKNTIPTAVDTKKEAVASVSNQDKESSGKMNQEVDGVQKPNDPLIKKDISIAETTKTEIAAIEKSTNKTEAEITIPIVTEPIEKKRSILEAIEEQQALEAGEAIAEEKTKIDQRWEVAPNFAPVYYSSLGGGSSIDPTFSDNTQSGDVNFSYGVQVSYALNERLSIRSGMSNVDLSYATSGVELGTGPVALALQSVDYSGKTTVLTAVDKGTLTGENGTGFGNITPKATSEDANLVQNLSYYEVPLELKYALLTNKFGVNIIGGLSTLFLGNNEVSVNAGAFESTLGEANNLSSVSFSTNIGLGFDYKLSRKFKFNIEPMFKYQLNPYTDSSIDFKPYYLGIYTGLSYKF